MPEGHATSTEKPPRFTLQWWRQGIWRRRSRRYLDCRREGAGEDKLEEALVLLRSKRAKVKLMLTQLDIIFGANREAELAELSRMAETVKIPNVCDFEGKGESD